VSEKIIDHMVWGEIVLPEVLFPKIYSAIYLLKFKKCNSEIWSDWFTVDS